MKRLLWIGGGIVVVLIVAVVVVVMSSGSIIKAAVETIGSEITKTKVTLDEADVSLTSGEGALKGLTMGNPAGFESESAARLGAIRVRLDVGSVNSDTVIVKEIVIAAPELTYELASGGSNIDTILRNVEASTGGGKGGAARSQPAGTEEGGKKLIVENLYVRDGRINVSATVLNGRTMTVPLPSIHLKDIGKDKGGASPGEVVEKVMAAISKGAADAVGKLGVGKAMDAAREGVEGAKKMMEGKAGEAREMMDKGTEGVGGAIKNLLGK